MAWIAVLSFWPSDSLSGACVLRSMIWSSSSRFTSIRRLHRHIWLRYSRKRGVKGKPRISLIGRFGLLV